MNGLAFLFVDAPSKDTIANRLHLSRVGSAIFDKWFIEHALPGADVDQFLVDPLNLGNRTAPEIDWMNGAIRSLYADYQFRLPLWP